MRHLRITTSQGEVVREPDRAAVAAAIEAAGHGGRDAFVVLDGDVLGNAPFLQAVHLGRDVWRVEVWRVEAHGTGERYWALTPDSTALADVFWSWAVGTDDWQHLRWQPVGDRPLAAAG